MADTKISAMTAATAATASTVPVVQGGVNKRVAMTGAGAAMIEASNAGAQAALLTTLMPKAGGAFTGLTGAGFRDTSAAFDVTLGFTSSVALDAGRALTIDMGNVAHTIALGTTAGTITFPNAAALTVAGLQIANVFTAAQTFSVNGAASTPALSLTGTILTGQTSTTNKPHLLIEPTGTTSNNWSTAGTLFGGNAPSGFAGMLLDLQINGDSQFSVTSASSGYARVKNSLQFGVGGVNSCGIAVHNGDNLLFNSDDNYVMKLYNTQLILQSTAQFNISSGTSYADTADIGFARTSAGVGRISDGSTGRGTLDAAGYQVGGVAGAAGGTFTTITSITVSNGIITAISGS